MEILSQCLCCQIMHGNAANALHASSIKPIEIHGNFGSVVRDVYLRLRLENSTEVDCVMHVLNRVFKRKRERVKAHALPLSSPRFYQRLPAPNTRGALLTT